MPSITGRPAEWRRNRHEDLAIVAGVQFTAERDVPPVLGAEAWARRGSRPPRVARSVSLASSGIPRSSSPESLARKRRDRTSGARAGCLELVDAAETEPAADRGRLPPGRARQQHESDAAMDGEDREAVVESRDLVHLGAIEQMPSQWCSASIAREARWDHETDSAARPDKLKRALDEELIQIQVRAALDLVDAGLANEVSQLPRVDASAGLGFAAPLSPRTMSHGGLPITASKPAGGPPARSFSRRRRGMSAANAESDAGRRWSRTVREGPLQSGAAASMAIQHRLTRSRKTARSGGVPSAQNQAPHHRSSAAFHLASDDSPSGAPGALRSLARTTSAESSGSVDTFDMTCAACASVAEGRSRRTA